MSELSTWRGFRRWRMLEYVSPTASQTIDLSVALGEDSWIVAVYTLRTDDVLQLQVGGLTFYRQTGTLNFTVEFERPIPVVMKNGLTGGPSPVTMVWTESPAAAGATRLLYIRKGT